MQQEADVVQDLDGNAVAGAAVQVLVKATGELAKLFADDETTQIANPVYTDANGRYAWKAANGKYRSTVMIGGRVFVGKADITLFDPAGALELNVKDFGAKGDDSTDDTAAFVKAINHLSTLGGGVLNVKGDFVISGIDIEANDLVIKGTGRIRCLNYGFKIVGNDNRVEGVTIHRATKSARPTMIYSRAGAWLVGDRNVVRGAEVFNMDGPGVIIEGRDCVVDRCYIHDNIAGVFATSKCRNIRVTNNRLTHNDVTHDSGADGLLLSRSVIGATVTGNDLSFNGEHGLYAQGQEMVISNNRVVGNYNEGLKFGSYDDGLYSYPGETLARWVNGTGFGLSGIIISENYIRDNGGGHGIYFQPSSREVLVVNNILENNSIRWVFFNYTGSQVRLEDHYNITVRGNKVRGINAISGVPSFIEVAAHSGVVIEDNEVAGRIGTYAANVTTTPRLNGNSAAPVIRRNRCDVIQPDRSVKARISHNEVRTLQIELNASEASITDNIIADQATLIDNTRVAEFSRNDLTCLTDIKLFGRYAGQSYGFNSIKRFKDNNIKANASTGAYVVEATTNSNNPAPEGLDFTGNSIQATACARPVMVSGSYGSVSGNVITNNGTGDYVLDVYGSNLTINGNAIKTGVIRLRNGGSVVTGNKAAISEVTAGSNTLAGNGNT